MGSVAALTVLTLAGPVAAEPTIEQVEARVDRLYRAAEVAQERSHDARIELRELRASLASLRVAEDRQDRRVVAIQDDLADTVASQYEGDTVSAVSSVLVSEDPHEFLAQLTTMAALTDAQTSLYDEYDAQLRVVALRRRETSLRAVELADVEERRAQDEAAVAGRLAEARDLLAELEEEERQAMLAASSSSPTPVAAPVSVPASGGAAAAVQYALAQVGDAYVYGASGPDAFDCSGLTSMAWAQAGVALPRSSSAQAGAGSPVASGDLRPGDLVFYYSPISHVALYIGNGMIVHAANPGSGVLVAGVFSMPYSGAVRPG